MEVGGSWKIIEFDQTHFPTRLGLCINGVIYYLAASLMSPDTVVSFDVRSEEFNMIIAPELGEFVGFIEYGGKPTLFDYTYLKNGVVDLWVLEDATSWSRKSLVLQPCQLHLVHNNIDEFCVTGTPQNGEIILSPTNGNYPDYMLYYDMPKNDLRKFEFRGLSDHNISYPYLHFTLMNTCESIMRLQT
ncbi:F-box protein [Cardamine amara subsp. amara]|uniref:F-box protein n=1 Tax=Cardamine amara subsp. amara TaxID=228776 RepID=A0ABD1AKS3_CARAN